MINDSESFFSVFNSSTRCIHTNVSTVVSCMIVVQSRSCLYVVFWKVCGDAGQAMRARHSECSVVIGQNETQQTTSQQHQQHQSQQQQQQPVQKPGTEKSTEVGSRLSNGSLDLAEQDSAVRVIDLQATLDKQVRISISILWKWKVAIYRKIQLSQNVR